MKILAIESSCDETAAAVVEDGRRVLSSVIATQVEEHKLYGGVVPEIASRRHSESIVGVVREALDKAQRGYNHSKRKYGRAIYALGGQCRGISQCIDEIYRRRRIRARV